MNNPIASSTPPSEPPPIPSSQPPGNSLGEILNALLKRPAVLTQHLRTAESSRYWVLLALAAVAAFTLYGLLIGTFSGGAQFWAAPVKVAGGMVLSAMICFPSLYIFMALTGVEITLRGLVGVLFAMLALTGLLLLGFAPIAWVFSQSTESVAFVGALYLAIWCVATAFGLRLLTIAAPSRSVGHLILWEIIFVMVALQMTTALRPIVGVAPEWLPKEKKFFVSYWADNLFKVEPPRSDE
jgi:hypothetical protein